MTDISTEIQGIHGTLSSCIMNASGALCTSTDELSDLFLSHSGAVISKSCTLLPREGNPFPRYYATMYAGGKEVGFPNIQMLETINSTGLANYGYQYYNPHTNHKLADVIKTGNVKPYIVSVCGLTLDDNITIIKNFSEYQMPDGKYTDIISDRISGIELNMSCPNVGNKGQICYDLEGSENLLRKIIDSDILNPDIGFGLKLSPYLDTVKLGEMADLISTIPMIDWTTCINSLGNGLIIDPISDRHVIKPRNGLGGIGGSVIKSIALSNVYQFCKEFGDKIDVIGCGGVVTSRDVYDHLLVGARAVQVGSLLVECGSSVFKGLNQGLRVIMEEKGYKEIEDFRCTVTQFCT